MREPGRPDLPRLRAPRPLAEALPRVPSRLLQGAVLTAVIRGGTEGTGLFGEGLGSRVISPPRQGRAGDSWDMREASQLSEGKMGSWSRPRPRRWGNGRPGDVARGGPGVAPRGGSGGDGIVARKLTSNAHSQVSSPDPAVGGAQQPPQVIPT